MSVILDALHKARGDKAARTEPQANSVARVLDATNATAPPPIAIDRPSRRREWFLAASLIMLMLILFAAIGGALLLLYNVLLKQDQALAVATAPAGPPAPGNTAAPGSIPAHIGAPGQSIPDPGQPIQAENSTGASPALLPTPLPLSELPVQPPAAAATNPATAAAFTLGSIVCENNDCIASLNNRSVRVGDVVKGFTVATIDSTLVTLKNATTGEEITLSLFD